MSLGDAWGQESESYQGALDIARVTGQAFEQAAPGVLQTAEANKFPGESTLDAIGRLLPQLALAANQRELLKIQLERAQRGQPPLDASNYGLGVNVGLSPDTQKMLLIGAAGLAAVLLLPRLLGRR